MQKFPQIVFKLNPSISIASEANFENSAQCSRPTEEATESEKDIFYKSVERTLKTPLTPKYFRDGWEQIKLSVSVVSL